MQYPECGHHHIRQNDPRGGKQHYLCVNCGRQFIARYSPCGYSDWSKRLCLRMDVNGLGLRGLERGIGVAHPTVINWLVQGGERWPDADAPEAIPQGGELDELETFVGRKRDKVWIWTVVDHCQPGSWGWAVGDQSAETFRPLWQVIAGGQCCFWGRDGNPVYPSLIPDGEQIVSKTYMTRVEGENTGWRH